jgi:hypothetical protein
MKRLEHGKDGNDTIRLTGTVRLGCRQEFKRLHSEWPQVIPEHLKSKLVNDFNLQISTGNLATFSCGSCSEDRPLSEKLQLPLDSIDFNLLKRPDQVELDTKSDMDVDVSTGPHCRGYCNVGSWVIQEDRQNTVD